MNVNREVSENFQNECKRCMVIPYLEEIGADVSCRIQREARDFSPSIKHRKIKRVPQFPPFSEILALDFKESHGFSPWEGQVRSEFSFGRWPVVEEVNPLMNVGFRGATTVKRDIVSNRPQKIAC
ncbi:MAG: hypothetical protein Tsb009_24630 [Planctomycetaceae bacterium]